jgi:hypothetical protein
MYYAVANSTSFEKGNYAQANIYNSVMKSWHEKELKLRWEQTEKLNYNLVTKYAELVKTTFLFCRSVTVRRTLLLSYYLSRIVDSAYISLIRYNV